VILAPGMTAPEGSVTVPTMLAFPWLYAVALRSAMPISSNKGIRSMRYVLALQRNFILFSFLTAEALSGSNIEQEIVPY
jgi:hypothetical protein